METKKRKGISPIVATVLLVAMVIVIFLIVFLWMRGMTEETITKNEGQNIELTCKDVVFEKSYSSGKLEVINSGNFPIYKMNIEIIRDDDSYETKELNELSSEWPDSGLSGGASFSDNLNLEENVEKIVLTPVLLGKDEQGAKKSYACPTDDTGKEIVV